MFSPTTCEMCTGEEPEPTCKHYSPHRFCTVEIVDVPTEFPGRRFDGTFQLARGYPITGFNVAGTPSAANIVWQLADQNAANFVVAAQAAIQAVLPAGSVVAVVAPATVANICTAMHTFRVVVNCTENMPVSLAVITDGGQDLLMNGGFRLDSHNNEFQFPRRQDDPAQATSRVLCTNTANRGWETADPNRQFELWPAGFLSITPTPQGTAIIEINAFANQDIMWQTFQVLTPGTLNFEVTLGGRGAAQNIRVNLSTGDTNGNLPGDIFNQVVLAGRVTGAGNPPWTVFNRAVVMAPGTYTLAVRGPNTGGGAGGLFTNMRALTTAPNTTHSIVGSKCVVVRDVPTPQIGCEWWTPVADPVTCRIHSWMSEDQQTTLTSADFFSRVPEPVCCKALPRIETITPANQVLISAHVFAATNVAFWSPAQAPAGDMVRLWCKVLSGTCVVTHQGGSQATLLTGAAEEWVADKTTGVVTPPVSIFPQGAGAQTIVLMEMRT